MATRQCKWCHGTGQVPLAPTMQAILEIADETTWRTQREFRVALKEMGKRISPAPLAGYLLKMNLWGFLARMPADDASGRRGYKYKRVGGS